MSHYLGRIRQMLEVVARDHTTDAEIIELIEELEPLAKLLVRLKLALAPKLDDNLDLGALVVKIDEVMARDNPADGAFRELIKELEPLTDLLVQAKRARAPKLDGEVDPETLVVKIVNAASLRLLGEFYEHLPINESDLIGWVIRKIEQESARVVGSPPPSDLLTRAKRALAGKLDGEVDPEALVVKIVDAASLRLRSEFHENLPINVFELFSLLIRKIEQESVRVVGSPPTEGPEVGLKDKDALAMTLRSIVGTGHRRGIFNSLFAPDGGWLKAKEAAQTSEAAVQVVFLRILMELEEARNGEAGLQVFPLLDGDEPDALDLALKQLGEKPAGPPERTLAAMLAAVLSFSAEGHADPLQGLRESWMRIDETERSIDPALLIVKTATRIWAHSRNFSSTPSSPEARGSISMIGNKPGESGPNVTARLAWGRYLACLARHARWLQERPECQDLISELDAFQTVGSARDRVSSPKADLFTTIVFLTAREGLTLVREFAPDFHSGLGQAEIFRKFCLLVESLPPKRFYEILIEGGDRAIQVLDDPKMKIVAKRRDEGESVEVIGELLEIPPIQVLALFREIQKQWQKCCFGSDIR